MGRPPIGKTAMTDAERQRRHRAKIREEEITPEAVRTAFILRADAAARMAEYSGRATKHIHEAVQAAADAWTKLAKDLQKRISRRKPRKPGTTSSSKTSAVSLSAS